jgi:hypothetical protein
MNFVTPFELGKVSRLGDQDGLILEALVESITNTFVVK